MRCRLTAPTRPRGMPLLLARVTAPTPEKERERPEDRNGRTERTAKRGVAGRREASGSMVFGPPESVPHLPDRPRRHGPPDPVPVGRPPPTRSGKDAPRIRPSGLTGSLAHNARLCDRCEEERANCTRSHNRDYGHRRNGGRDPAAGRPTRGASLPLHCGLRSPKGHRVGPSVSETRGPSRRVGLTPKTSQVPRNVRPARQSKDSDTFTRSGDRLP